MLLIPGAEVTMNRYRRYSFIAAAVLLRGAPLQPAPAQTAPAVEAAYTAILAHPKGLDGVTRPALPVRTTK
jgi:hypothetical protein